MTEKQIRQETANNILDWLRQDIDHHDLQRILEKISRTGELNLQEQKKNE